MTRMRSKAGRVTTLLLLYYLATAITSPTPHGTSDRSGFASSGVVHAWDHPSALTAQGAVRCIDNLPILLIFVAENLGSQLYVRPMPPKVNRRRAVFVLAKIDKILAWEQRRDTERDTKFVELGRYVCEVRAGQLWRLKGLKCFDKFLERRFPESTRKAYYLMSIHENLPPQARKELKEVG